MASLDTAIPVTLNSNIIDIAVHYNGDKITGKRKK